MPTMRRAALLGLMTIFLAATVRAQTEPPPATLPPPAAQPQGQEPPPPAPSGAPPAPATSAPVTPLAPTLAPDPGQGPALQLTERSPQDQQQTRPTPLYRQTWFWAAFGLAFVTAFIITFVVLRDKASDPPHTTFGNMHAF